MTSNHSSLKLVGETVTISYVADPAIGHGKFRLENGGEIQVTASIKSAWLQFGDRQQLLDNISVFDSVQDNPFDPHSFTVEAGTELNFLLGFPPMAVDPRFGETYGVGLRLQVNGLELEAVSEINLVQRIPRER